MIKAPAEEIAPEKRYVVWEPQDGVLFEDDSLAAAKRARQDFAIRRLSQGRAIPFVWRRDGRRWQLI